MSHDTNSRAAEAASPRKSPSTPGTKVRSAHLETLLKDLDRPLDKVDWTAPVSPKREKSSSPKFIQRVRRHRQHRRELRRARRAAASVFRTTPRRSKRKRAALMMGTGALSLGAFTQPPAQTTPVLQSSVVALPDLDIRQDASLLKASDEFKQALIEEEGVRYVVYRDVAGYPTVGVGHLVRPKDRLRVGDRISEQRALRFLDQDLAIAERGVRQLVGDLPLYQHEFDALVDLVYNVGLGNVSPKKSPRLNEAIEAGDYEAIADELDYRRAGGKFARGLKYRSERRANIFMNAAYEDPRELEASQG